MVVTFDLVSPVFRLFSSQKLKTKTCYSKCAGASQTLRTQAPAALGGCKCSATHARLTPASRCANLVCDVTGLSVFYVVSACPILKGKAARFSWQMEVTQAGFLELESTLGLPPRGCELLERLCTDPRISNRFFEHTSRESTVHGRLWTSTVGCGRCWPSVYSSSSAAA